MASEGRSVRGRVVTITGGARGIGLATARALASRGAKVAIGDLDAELSEQAAAKLPGETAGFALDVTDRESFAGFLGAVEERFGPVEVLINNAGIMPIGPFVEEDDATAHRMIDINLHGVIYGMKLALPGMVARGDGHIVNLASQAGKTGFPGGATYCATKHAVVGLSEAVRGETIDTGVEISCVMPAVVNTELGSGLAENRAVKKVEPEDVAEAIVAALEKPKFDVHVPASAGVIGQVVGVLPRRAREAIGRALKFDRVLAEPNKAERAAYEQRAARSEPGLEPEAVPGDAKVESKPEAAEGAANGSASEEKASVG